MSHESKTAILQAGIIPESSVEELARWGLDVPLTTIEENQRLALENIREAIESRDMVEVRITDVNALMNYKENHRPGRLYFSVKRGQAMKTSFVDVTFVKTETGDYLIPWAHEDIFDLMLAETTYLKPVGEARVHFVDVSPLYYGERKFFMVCKPQMEAV